MSGKLFLTIAIFLSLFAPSFSQEAEAICDYKNPDNEVSFKKGDVIRVLDEPNGNFLYVIDEQGRKSWVPHDCLRYHAATWYKPGLSSEVARKWMERIDYEGAFIIAGGGNKLTMFVRHGKEIRRFEILMDSDGNYFIWLVKFSELDDLVNYYRTSSLALNEDIYLKDMNYPFATAIYDFVGSSDEDLSLQKGDTISIISEDDSGWILAMDSKGKQGFVPSAYLERTAKVLFDFEADEKDELGLKKGDVVTITKYDESGWSFGRNSDGQEGLFPSAYVEII